MLLSAKMYQENLLFAFLDGGANLPHVLAFQ